MTVLPGATNSITDVSGLRVGNAHDTRLKSGVTTLICDIPNTASVHIMGGAPGTRDTEALYPENTVSGVDALVLSGGSAFGLDACGGVQSLLREQGRGFAVRDQRIPIVPGAILFDLINGGDKDWGLHSPYLDLGYKAAGNASVSFEIGSVGAGIGALTGGLDAGLKGGLGTASSQINGVTIAALVAVNALGSATIGDSKHFWAAPFELNDEFGGLGSGNVSPKEAKELNIKFRSKQTPRANTTIGIIATNATLTDGETKRLAIAAHDGFARALWPTHTPLDGDLVFSLSTGTNDEQLTIDEHIDLSAIAASTMARAVARGVFSAATDKNDLFPTWTNRFVSD